MKATEQSFPVVLFTMLYMVVLTFEYVTIKMKPSKQGVPVVLFKLLKKMVPAF